MADESPHQVAWTAHWIEPLEPADLPELQRPAQHLATEFRVAGPVRSATLRITAHDLKQLGVIDAIVPEPADGAHTDADAQALILKQVLVRHLRELLPKEPRQLVDERYARYRAFGAPCGRGR